VRQERLKGAWHLGPGMDVLSFPRIESCDIDLALWSSSRVYFAWHRSWTE
jgi:hypothetical protein